MINNTPRIGNFTSSEIGNLMKKDRSGKGFGAPALTYIEECNMERRLGRSITDEVSARPLLWGKLLEERAFDLLGLEYTLTSKDTITHPAIPYWAGSPDGGKDEPKTVVDIKCPITLKSFCQLVDNFKEGGMDQVRAEHKDGDKYYWQIVSNAILTGSDNGELIVYMPYRSELADIRMMVQLLPGEIIGKYYCVATAMDDELPYLLDGGYYRNVNILSFPIPDADKKALTDAVLRAGEMLVDLNGTPKTKAAILEDANALKI